MGVRPTLIDQRLQENALRSQTATIEGVTLRWEQTGGGPTVVLVHGIPTSPELWRHVVPRLDHARIVAFEMLGYGRSILAGEGHDLSIAAQARYLNGLLDHLGVDQVVLVGHDLGGGVAQIAAVERPERIAGLVLTNAIAYDSWPIPSVKMLRAASAVTARMPAPALKATLGTLVSRGHDDLAMARESLELHFAHYVAADGAAGLARQVTALDVDDTLANVLAETVGEAGLHDPHAPWSNVGEGVVLHRGSSGRVGVELGRSSVSSRTGTR